MGVWKANIFSTEAESYKARGYAIGEPVGTEALGADELRQHGMVGICLPEGVSDPKLENGGLYFEQVEPAPEPAAKKKRRRSV